MAGAQWTDITLKMLSRGIDSYSSRANIPDGYVEDLENFDTNASGLLRKRLGYISEAGWLPIRVTRVERDGYVLKFQLDSSQAIDLLTTDLGPIITYGRLDEDITTTSTKLYTTNVGTWWSSVSLTNKETLSAGSNTITKTSTDHGISSNTMFVGFAEVDSSTASDNTTLIPDAVTIDKTTYQVDLDYTAVSSGEGYVYISDMTAVSGSVYHHTLSGVTSATITAATHNLSNYYIQVKCYATVGADYVEVIPDLVTIDQGTGQVVITFDTAVTGIAILNAVPLANVSSTSAATGSNTLTVSSPGSAWNFVSIYAYNSGSGLFESVIPDAISYVESTDTLSIDYTLATATEAVDIYWENGDVVNNVIQVTDSTGGSETWTDTNPQITIWGISHANMYKTAANRGGHVNHIDQYRRTGESRVIAGLGGNLFADRTREGVGSSYLLPSSYVHLRDRVNGDIYVAPLFQSATITRTRGGIVDTAVSSNLVTVTAATYVSSTATDYTLSFDSAATITSKVDTNDEFVITGMPYAALNGTFKFVSVSNDASTAPVIRLKNTSGNARYDCTNTSGKAGCFTDYIPLTANNHIGILAGDSVLSEAIGSSLSVTVVDKVGDNIYVRGITAGITWPDNVRIAFSSTARSLIPLRDTDNTVTVANYVAGDMVTITGNDHPARVARVGAGTNGFATSITGDGTTATVTHALSPDLEAGDRVLITGSSIPEFNGEITVVSVPSTTSFTYASTGSGTDSSGDILVLSNLLELDNSVAVSDYSAGTTVDVDHRWIPVETPADTYDLTVKNYRKHFESNDYDNQPILRSVMVNDTLFLTNGEDEVMKFDGDNLYRAGLFRWNPYLFTQIDTSTGSIIPTSTSVTVANGGTNGNVYTMATVTEAGMFTAGDRVQDSKDNAYYTVVEVDAVTGFVEVDRKISGDHTTGGTVTVVDVYSYYFRLNAIDANNNIVAGAVTASKDCIVELGSSGQIKHRLVGFPAWDAYDYDRIELQMYRTKANSAAPFYLIQTVPISFNNYYGYIDLIDTTPDYTLTNNDLDIVHSGLLGRELGVGWEEPLRASHITSTNNRLVLGNCTGYPKWDIVINKKAQEDTIAASDLHGLIFTFRKDGTSTSTTTNMTDVVRYELRDVSSASPVDIYPSGFDFVDGDVTTDPTNTIAETGHGLLTGHKVRLTTTGTLPTGLATGTDYYVIKVDADTFKLATSLANAAAGTAITIAAAAGGGTHTVVPQSGIATTSTTFTINSVAHGLSAGDWVYLYHAAAGAVNDLTFAGWWQIASVATDTFTIKMSNHGRTTSGGTANDVDTYAVASTTTDIPVLLGTDGNYNQKDGNISTTYETKAMTRLAAAINASMRVCDTTIETDFVPWIVADAGNDFSRGQLMVRQPKVLTTTSELLLPTWASTKPFDIYVHGLLRTSASEVSSSTNVYPSRVVLSYPSYPEIFDNPDAIAEYSGSAVDINAADGQAITAVITFFGESTFGAAQLNDALVIFKENSIYVMNSESQAYQKLDSRGLGCGSPRSVAATQNGIMFANKSGIYRLNRDMTISRVGKYLERYWKNTVNGAQLAEATGHQYAQGRTYKLSVPVGDDLYTSKVLVYNHETEGAGQEYGSWTRYSAHNATGWCNLQNDAFFGTTTGDVFKIRNLGVASDFRDDASAITSTVTTRGNDFGLPGARKIIGGAYLGLQLETTDITNLTVTAAMDLKSSYSAAGTITVDMDSQSYATPALTLPSRRGTNVSLKISHGTIDEDVVLTGISYSVARLGGEGIKDAANYI